MLPRSATENAPPHSVQGRGHRGTFPPVPGSTGKDRVLQTLMLLVFIFRQFFSFQLVYEKSTCCVNAIGNVIQPSSL